MELLGDLNCLQYMRKQEESDLQVTIRGVHHSEDESVKYSGDR